MFGFAKTNCVGVNLLRAQSVMPLCLVRSSLLMESATLTDSNFACDGWEFLFLNQLVIRSKLKFAEAKLLATTTNLIIQFAWLMISLCMSKVQLIFNYCMFCNVSSQKMNDKYYQLTTHNIFVTKTIIHAYLYDYNNIVFHAFTTKIKKFNTTSQRSWTLWSSINPRLVVGRNGTTYVCLLLFQLIFVRRIIRRYNKQTLMVDGASSIKFAFAQTFNKLLNWNHSSKQQSAYEGRILANVKKLHDKSSGANFFI